MVISTLFLLLDLEVAALTLLIGLAGGLLGFLAIIVANTAWMNFAIDLDRVSSDLSYDIVGNANRAAVPAIAVVGSLTLLCYFLSLAGFRRRGVVSGSFMSLVRTDLTGFFHSPMIEDAAAVLAIAGLLSWTASLSGMQELVASIFFARQTGPVDVVTLFPILPIGLLATCVLIAIARPPVGHNLEQMDEIRDQFRRPVPAGRRPGSWRGMVATIASAVMMVAFIYPIHFGMVAALGVLTGIGLWTAISSGVDGWIAAESEKGRGSPELAADLNRHGRWSAASPGEAFPDNCTVRIAAGTVGPPVAGEAEPDLKFCVAVACAPPFTWSSPPALLLVTSHVSEADSWHEYMYADVLAEGRARAPGGYCTADGRLAESFQG